MEKNWNNTLTELLAKKLTIKALLEVVDSGSKHMEIAIIRNGQPVEVRLCMMCMYVAVY